VRSYCPTHNCFFFGPVGPPTLQQLTRLTRATALQNAATSAYSPTRISSALSHCSPMTRANRDVHLAPLTQLRSKRHLRFTSYSLRTQVFAHSQPLFRPVGPPTTTVFLPFFTGSLSFPTAANCSTAARQHLFARASISDCATNLCLLHHVSVHERHDES
jgi:hypothetical protein